MDQYDQATALEELERDRSIARVRSMANYKPVTRCLLCNDKIDLGKFCSIECRDDYEIEMKVAHICGR